MGRTWPAYCLFVAAMGGLVLLIGCGGATPSETTTVLAGREGRPDVPVPVGPPPKKLVVRELRKGSGRAAANGGKLSVRYLALAYRGHRIYEDRWRQVPPSFVLGDGQMAEAWEEGLPGIRAGGRRELVVPGGEATLGGEPEIYVVEAISVGPPKKRSAPARTVVKVAPTGSKPKIASDLGSPPSHLIVRTLKEGSSARVRRGDHVGARFIDVNYKTHQVQDFWGPTPDGVAPYRFVLGGGGVRPGWEVTLPGKRLGTRLELLLPSRLAYGNGPMRYVVELLEREKPASGGEG